MPFFTPLFQRVLQRYKPLAIGAAFIKRYKVQTAVVTTIIVIAALLESVSVMSILPLFALLFDNGQAQFATLPPGAADFMRHLSATIGLGGLLGVIAIGFFIKAMLMIGMMRYVQDFLAKLQADFRRTIIDNLLRARWPYFTDLSLGAVTNTLGNEITVIGTTYRQFIDMLSALIQGFFYVLLSVAFSPAATLFAVIFGGVIMLSLKRFIGKTRVSGNEYTAALRVLSGRMTDIFSSIKSIRAMGKEDSMKPLLSEPSDIMQENQRIFMLYNEVMIQVQEWLLVVGISVMMFIFMRYMHFTITEFMFMAIILQRISSRLNAVQRTYQQIARNEKSFDQVQDLITQSAQNVENFNGTKQPSLTRDIVIDHVSFAYDTRIVLKDISLIVARGQRVALIGPSGSGKSTLIDILTGMQQPQQGVVAIDGQSLKDIDINAWRHMIGYVPQETLLLHSTIRSNVSLNDTSISDIQITKALQQAEMWDVVSSWPEKLDTMVGERGIKLSGGQRQRIALARALVKNPQLLILDEATSALDPETEAKICETLTHLGRDITIIAISHQKALAQIADATYAIQNGQISRV